jgi:hypothetical protein
LYGLSPADMLQPTVRRGPRRGHDEQIILIMPQAKDPVSERLLRALTNELGKLPEVREVIPSTTSPQRGAESSRELVEVVIRFVRRIKPDEAERLVRRTLKMMRFRWKRLSSPVLRAERRDRERAKCAEKRSRQHVKDLNRWLGQPV